MLTGIRHHHQPFFDYLLSAFPTLTAMSVLQSRSHDTQ